MSIIVKSKLYTSTKDRIVYKHMMDSPLRANLTTEYCSPYERAEIVFDRTMLAEIRLSSDVSHSNSGFHSFLLKKNANEQASNFREYLVQCIIPKGSKYYLGTYGEYKAIVSNQIVYVKIIHKHENKYTKIKYKDNKPV